jgi:RNA polymerase sigma-70 factor (ECF subfamily)
MNSQLRSLIDRRRGEKVTGMETIYEQHFKNVYRYALSLCRNETVAEDITNETFLKAIHAIDKFNGNCDIKVWLCQIARNTYFSLLKKAKHTVPLEPEITDMDGDFVEKLMDRASVLEIHRCLHRLEEPYKEIFSLRTFGELSFAEIAGLFGKTENWARVTYHRAKLKLKEALL